MNTTCKIFSVLLVASLCGCGSILVPAPEVEPEPKVINPAITDAVDIYCKNLINVRRIALRFIRALDPQWESVCDRD